MSKLLKANFSRLKFSLEFWVCVIVSCSIGIINVLANFYISGGHPFSLVGQFICGSTLSMFPAAFIPLYIGTDHSDSAMRNKLIAGHTRAEIYLSYIIVAVVCSLIIYITYFLPSYVIGSILGGRIDMGAGEFLKLLFINSFTMISLAAIYSMTAILVSKKSNSVTISLVGTFVFFMASVIFGTVSIRFETPLEAVLSITAVFFIKVLPFGQAIQAESGVTSMMFPVYSFAVTVLSAAIGIIVFRRKDLK